MKNYRLKKEAVPFFNEKMAASIRTFEEWEKSGVDINALEEVEGVYVSYGRKLGDDSKTLNGWSSQNGSYFEFTIHYPSVQMREHDEFTNGRMSRELMDKIQGCVNDFYFNFVNQKP